MAKKQPKILVSGERDGCYVKAWKEGRGEYVVQVWLSLEPVGEPAGDWAMPAVIGITAAIAQAILQTRHDAKAV